MHIGDGGQERLNTGTAHSARVYDYILGGKNHYEADTVAGDAMVEVWPALPVHMRANRAFMLRASRYLARERGVRQFLDIGTGLPTSPNLHEVVQGAAPESKVVYVDNDPIVLNYAQALLTSTPEGRTTYIEADMRDPDAILGSAEFRDTLALDEPVALLVVGMLHFIHPGDDDHGLLSRLLDPLPAGSYLAATVGTADFAPEEVGRVAERYAAEGMPMALRTREEAAAFFDGLELVEPGLVQVHKWRPDPGDEQVRDEDIAMYGALARKPF
ncbi:SAM-dependent methyltransferase [Streptomyces diacarni]|uniref:SAM-dependent methyltransferase n=2 Tax=Streptomyces TaxID=1883 RepID=A0A367EAT9_9ACTN|nr:MULTISPECIES: SAM-dependent methyltransferase [Streptomyces]RCG14360.1 SAM-dependent methyltransferase [Streptomyces diacarni]UNS95530.1 SAM-dependent methyltransferase [Streptomyces tubbatahanensis]